MVAAPDLWDETALVSIKDGTTVMEVIAITETVDIDMGDKDGESIPNLGGGRLWKKTPEADTSITFEGYPVDIGEDTDTSPDGLMQFFMGNTDATQPLSASSSLTRTKYTVTIMWTDGTAASATASVAADNNALRYDFQNAYFVSCKPSFTDGALKATYVFKCPPFQKDGTSNITVESTDNTASMPVT